MQKSEIQHRPRNPLQHPQKLIIEITDVTIIEIEIEIVFLTEHRIESKSYFSCIPSNDLSIEALDRLLTPSCFNASTDRPHTATRAVVGN